MAIRTHMKDDGTRGVCAAQAGNCPKGQTEEEHLSFTTTAELNAHNSKLLEEQHGAVATTKRSASGALSLEEQVASAEEALKQAQEKEKEVLRAQLTSSVRRNSRAYKENVERRREASQAVDRAQELLALKRRRLLADERRAALDPQRWENPDLPSGLGALRAKEQGLQETLNSPRAQRSPAYTQSLQERLEEARTVRAAVEGVTEARAGVPAHELLKRDVQDEAVAYEAALRAQEAVRSSPAPWKSPEMIKLRELHAVAQANHKVAQRTLEDQGMGHLIPDRENTFRVSSQREAILMKEELIGQFSDGAWENSGGEGWQDWSDAKIVVDPKNPGRNFTAQKDNYNLTRPDLLDAVGDRMEESVRSGTGEDSYDTKAMRRDLTSLKKTMKTQRPTLTETHTAAGLAAAQETLKTSSSPSPTAPSPSPSASSGGSSKPRGAKSSKAATSAGSSPRIPKGVPGSPTPQAVVAAAGNKQQQSMKGRHIGQGDVLNQQAYGFGRSGGAYIVAREDGSRARAYIPKRVPKTSEGVAALGTPLDFQKEQKDGSTTTTDGLRVVGFVDGEGKTHGWVPSSKVNIFVD